MGTVVEVVVVDEVDVDVVDVVEVVLEVDVVVVVVVVDCADTVKLKYSSSVAAPSYTVILIAWPPTSQSSGT